jgi:hypothetical protein
MRARILPSGGPVGDEMATHTLSGVLAAENKNGKSALIFKNMRSEDGCGAATAAEQRKSKKKRATSKLH